MYQPLIWPAVLGDDARRLGAPLDAEDLERQADALVDRMRRNAELGGNLLGRQMLVDEAQAVELSLRQPGNPLNHDVGLRRSWPMRSCGPAFRIIQAIPTPRSMSSSRARISEGLMSFARFQQIFSGFLVDLN